MVLVVLFKRGNTHRRNVCMYHGDWVFSHVMDEALLSTKIQKFAIFLSSAFFFLKIEAVVLLFLSTSSAAVDCSNGGTRRINDPSFPQKKPPSSVTN